MLLLPSLFFSTQIGYVSFTQLWDLDDIIQSSANNTSQAAMGDSNSDSDVDDMEVDNKGILRFLQISVYVNLSSSANINVDCGSKFCTTGQVTE